MLTARLLRNHPAAAACLRPLLAFGADSRDARLVARDRCIALGDHACGPDVTAFAAAHAALVRHPAPLTLRAAHALGLHPEAAGALVRLSAPVADVAALLAGAAPTTALCQLLRRGLPQSGPPRHLDRQLAAALAGSSDCRQLFVDFATGVHEHATGQPSPAHVLRVHQMEVQELVRLAALYTTAEVHALLAEALAGQVARSGVLRAVVRRVAPWWPTHAGAAVAAANRTLRPRLMAHCGQPALPPAAMSAMPLLPSAPVTLSAAIGFPMLCRALGVRATLSDDTAQAAGADVVALAMALGARRGVTGLSLPDLEALGIRAGCVPALIGVSPWSVRSMRAALAASPPGHVAALHVYVRAVRKGSDMTATPVPGAPACDVLVCGGCNTIRSKFDSTRRVSRRKYEIEVDFTTGTVACTGCRTADVRRRSLEGYALAGRAANKVMHRLLGCSVCGELGDDRVPRGDGYACRRCRVPAKTPAPKWRNRSDWLLRHRCFCGASAAATVVCEGPEHGVGRRRGRYVAVAVCKLHFDKRPSERCTVDALKRRTV